MDLAQYQQIASYTANTAQEHDLRLAVAAMGLAGESAEVLELVHPSWSPSFGDRDKLVKELGDVMWYLAEIATVLGIPLGSVIIGKPAEETALLAVATGVVIHAGGLADYLKKVVGHKHPLNLDRVKEALALILNDLNDVCAYIRVPLPEICDHNIAKLRSRYPAGFSTERSINRVSE